MPSCVAPIAGSYLACTFELLRMDLCAVTWRSVQPRPRWQIKLADRKACRDAIRLVVLADRPFTLWLPLWPFDALPKCQGQLAHVTLIWNYPMLFSAFLRGLIGAWITICVTNYSEIALYLLSNHSPCRVFPSDQHRICSHSGWSTITLVFAFGVAMACGPCFGMRCSKKKQ